MTTTIKPLLRPLPSVIHEEAARIGHVITPGLPKQTWNGMSADTYQVGQKHGGARDVHLLPPGVYRPTVKEAYERFVWNARRQELWNRLEAAAPRLKSEYGVTHVALGGSFFSTDWYRPGDIDGVAFYEDPSRFNAQATVHGETPLQRRNLTEGDNGVHLYDYDVALVPFGGPRPLEAFSHVAPNPRPESIPRGRPPGEEVGTVVFDLEDLIHSDRSGRPVFEKEAAVPVGKPRSVLINGVFAGQVEAVAVRDSAGQALGFAYPEYQYKAINMRGATRYERIPESRTLTFNGRPVGADGVVAD